MRAILVLSSILVLASARPDVSHGYKYDTPPDNYEGAVPEQTGSNGGETLPNFVPVQAHSGPGVPPVYPDAQQPDNFIPTGPSDVQLQGVPQFSQTAPDQQVNLESQALTTGSEAYRNSNDEQQKSFGSSYDAVASGIPEQQQQPPQQPLQQQQQNTFGGSVQQQSSFSQQQSASSSFSQGSQQQSVSSSFSQDSQSDELPPLLTKNFYVYAAPEEPEEETQGPKFVNIGRKQKNYKIIFIKAPTYGFNSQVIPIVQPNEEKTIVYVLSKKPSYNQDISLPPAPVTEPSKPEVFFIKYKTENEAREAQQKIQGQYESNSFAGASDNIAANIGAAVSGFQSQGASALNAVAGQSAGISNNVGAAVASNDEQSELAAASESESAIGENLVETQSSSEQPARQQQQQYEQYLPPNH